MTEKEVFFLTFGTAALFIFTFIILDILNNKYNWTRDKDDIIFLAITIPAILSFIILFLIILIQNWNVPL